MKGWLMDTYRNKNQIILWIKTKNDNLRLTRNLSTSVYLEPFAEKFLNQNRIKYFPV